MSVNIHSRYWGLDTVEVNGERSLTQRIIHPVEEHRCIRHTIVGGETPDQIAELYYNREDLWWRIADANPGVFPLEWKAGDVLLIPPRSIATRTPR